MESSLLIAIVNSMSGFVSGSTPSTSYVIKENGIDIIVTQGDNIIIPEQ